MKLYLKGNLEPCHNVVYQHIEVLQLFPKVMLFISLEAYDGREWRLKGRVVSGPWSGVTARTECSFLLGFPKQRGGVSS